LLGTPVYAHITCNSSVKKIDLKKISHGGDVFCHFAGRNPKGGGHQRTRTKQKISGSVAHANLSRFPR
jgi:hypothetical protein